MKKNLKGRLKELNFIIASHIFVTGPALDLEEYLQGKTKSLLFIGHPFAYAKEKNSFFRFYQNGKLLRKHRAITLIVPQLFLNIKDIILTLWWVLKREEKFHFFLGSDSMMAFWGLVLKLLGRVEHVILYTIDYMPQRFDSPVLNWLYHFFDRVCLKYCKIVWNVSPRMAEAREKYDGITPVSHAPQIVVPLGIWYQRISQMRLLKKDRFTIVFMGHLLAKQGVDLVIKAMPLILKKIPQAKLLIIGTGEWETYLKKLSSRLNLEKNIEFGGFVESHKDVEKMLGRSTLAVAMYKPDPLTFTNWSDPGKLKNYLAAGLPIFLTSVPHIAKEIEKRKCGFIVSYDAKKLAENITALLLNRHKLNEYRQNATNFARQFDWDKIFAKALNQSIT